jgi:putative ABC transport system substrate-binding protein
MLPVRKIAGGMVLLCLLLALASSLDAQTVAIVTSDSLTSTQRTISGATRVISQTHNEAKFYHFQITSPVTEGALADTIRGLHPNLIMTVGSRATAFSKEYFSSTPVVFSAVLYPAMSGFVETLQSPGRNITGASLNISAQTQFIYFKEIIPDLKTVGVLYTENTAMLIPHAKILAEQEGLTLLPIKIEHEHELPGAIDSLAKTVDGIWSVADPRLFTPQATKFILVRALKLGVPFMGFSRHVVASGALFALDFDYKAIGRQAGRISVRILDGTPPGQISVTDPDVIWFHYNEKTARMLGITVPESLAAVAKEVYR